MVDSIPGIFEKEWEMIEERLRLIAPSSPWAHICFADGTLFPTKSFFELDKLVPLAQLVQLEAHLLVSSPEKYIKAAADAGFKRLIAHVEAHDPRIFLEAAKFENVEVGVAIDGATEFEEVEPFLEEVDFVLVMTAESGSDTFLPECVEKIKSIHLYLPDLPIEAEGGITLKTAPAVLEAGATRLVSSPAVAPLLFPLRATSRSA